MTTINNISPMATIQAMNKHSSKESKLLNQLSSGKKINKGSDDVIGMAKAKQLEKAVRSLDAADRNITNASNKLDTAVGGLSATLEQLQGLRELAVKGADSTLSLSERRSVKDQANAAMQEVDRLAQNIKFDAQALLDGSQDNKEVMVGENAGDNKTIRLKNASVDGLQIRDVDVSSADNASASLESLDAAIREVSTRISQAGSQSESFMQAASNNKERSSNLSQARSVTEDLDYALALGELKATQIKKESSTQTLSALLQNNKNGVTKLF